MVVDDRGSNENREKVHTYERQNLRYGGRGNPLIWVTKTFSAALA